MIKKSVCILISLLLMLTILSSCGTNKQGKPEAGGIYAFEDYESGEVFDISKVDLRDELDQVCVSYRFTYLSDGLKIKAYISIPLSAIESQEPSKCLMYNHGGNRDYGKLKDETTANVCALSGRVVVASQYRGVGGSEGEDHFGGDDLNDVIKLIDLCENSFTFIDMDDFCVAGASRGGVMTYPAARQDKRIKRIIAISAVSDLFESYEAREDMHDVLEETIGCTPQENPAEYEKRSAVYWADEITVPVLMIHSKQDAQVSYSQAEELYGKLKDVTDCTLITHDDDVHGLHKEDYETIRKWLDK